MIQSLLRSMEILEILSRECRAYSLAEISQAAGLPPSTVHRVLQTFGEGGYVVRDGNTHLYKLGPSLVSLGVAASRQVDLRKAVMPELRTLTAQTGEDSYLVMPNGFRGIMVDKVEGPSKLKVVEHFGYEQDLDVGGIRKSLLAFSNSDFINRYTDYYRQKHTEEETQRMLAALEKVRKEGVSETTGEYIKEGIGIGAPVFDSKGDAVASIGVIMLAATADRKTVDKVRELVMKTAARVSKNLGYYVG